MDARFRILPLQIPDFSSGSLLIFVFRYLGINSMVDFVIEGHVCECMFVCSYFHN